MSTTTDLELLDAWIAGDARSGQLLAGRHYEAVRRFFDIRVPEAAEDLTQRTFLACTQARARFRGAGSFRAYLFGIARRQLLLQLREHRRSDALQTFAEAAPADSVLTATGVIAARDEQRLLLRAFESLSEEQKTVVQLFYWEELPVGDIAEILELSVTAVTSRLDRARQAMRRFVHELPARPATRALLEDLDGWTRSVVPRSRGAGE